MIPRDTPPGTELRGDGGRVYYLVQWRPRRPVVTPYRTRGAGYYETPMDMAGLRLATEEERSETVERCQRAVARAELTRAIREVEFAAAEMTSAEVAALALQVYGLVPRATK